MAGRHAEESQHLQCKRFGRVIILETNNENNFSSGCEEVQRKEEGEEEEEEEEGRVRCWLAREAEHASKSC